MNRRTAPIFCALIALLLSALASVARAQPHHGPNESAEVRRTKEKEYRSIEVRGVPDGVGVSSGLVVVYGHPLQQPYHFVHRDHRLFINGVQVEPTLIMQRESDKTRHDMTTDDAQRFGQLQDLAKKARSAYFEKHGKVADEKLRADILAMVRSHRLIKDAEWAGDQILYHQKGAYEAVTTAISFLPRSARADAKPKKAPEQLVADHVKDLEDHLKSGGCLFYGTVGAWQGPAYACADIKKSVRQIMNQPTLSTDEKETKLRGVFNDSHEAPLDIIANYRADEWK